MNETLKSLIEANPDDVRSYPLKSFELMGQTVSVGIIRDRAPERCQDDVKVFVNSKLYETLYFPLDEASRCESGTLPIRIFKFKGQTIHIGIGRFHDNYPPEDVVAVLVNRKNYKYLHFPLNEN